jgi:hypothetical protein
MNQSSLAIFFAFLSKFMAVFARPIAPLSLAVLASALLTFASAPTIAQIAGPSNQQIADNKDEASALIELRRKLDKLVWGPEVIAQQYETRITELWDTLLKADDKLGVLADFPFSSLTLAKLQKSEALSLQIARYTFAEPGEVWTNARWRQTISDLKKQGYILEQSEWHHAQFAPPANGVGARSEVSFALHIMRAEPAHRIIVKGHLDIQWRLDVSAGGKIEPQDVAVLDMHILEREAKPAFEQVFQISGTEQRPLIHPLLVYDVDGDGLSEVIAAGQNVLLRNQGQGKLVAEDLFASNRPIYDGAVLADFSGDGIVDFIGVDDTNLPFMVKGDEQGRFLGDRVRISDIDLPLPKTFTAGDIDGDGDLDLHIANYKFAYRQGQMPDPYFDANDGYPAVMFRNDGKGRFTDITESSGLAEKRNRRSYSSSFVDLDDDGDQDLIVVSDYAGFDVYLNNGKGKFKDITDEFGLDRHFFGMGHTFDDFDGDGKLDFYVIGMSSTTARRLEALGVGRKDLQQHTEMRTAMGYGNRMFLRRDDGFIKAPFNDQIARTGWSWGTSTFDFDNDGDKDIFVANGHYSGESTQDYCTTFWRHDIYEGGEENVAKDILFQVESTDLREADISWNGYEHKVLYLKHNGEYVDIAYLMGVAFEYDARAVVSEDIDADGRPDLLVVEHQAQGLSSAVYNLHIYKNVLAEAGNWIGVRLKESTKVSPIGATIKIQTKDGTQMTRIVTGDSFSSQHSASAHFGLGQLTAVEKLTVIWANGKITILDKPKANQYHQVGL